eukprot:1187818-Prorocentrum_minimum.AAC.1
MGTTFLDVARPPSLDPPPGDRLPGVSTDLKSGVGQRERRTWNVQPNVKRKLENWPFRFLFQPRKFLIKPGPPLYNCMAIPSLTLPGLARRSDKPSAARRTQGGRWEEAAHHLSFAFHICGDTIRESITTHRTASDCIRKFLDVQLYGDQKFEVDF